MSISDTKIVPGGDRFDIDVDNSEGLSLRVKGGVILAPPHGFRSVPNATLSLTPSATNFVEANDAGAISVNADGFTAGYTSLYAVTTDAGSVTGVEDWRGSGRASVTQIMTASGAIRDDAEIVVLNNADSAIAATIATIRAGRDLVIVQADGGTEGHTVTIAGGGANTFDGTNEIATLNAAAEALVLRGVSATRFAILLNIGSVGLSS